MKIKKIEFSKVFIFLITREAANQYWSMTNDFRRRIWWPFRTSHTGTSKLTARVNLDVVIVRIRATVTPRTNALGFKNPDAITAKEIIELTLPPALNSPFREKSESM